MPLPQSFSAIVLCVKCAYYKGSETGAASTSVIVYPLSQGPITRQQQGHDVTLASLVGVLHAGGLEPANFERACQGIDLESPDRAGDAGGDAVDAEHEVLWN